MNSTRFVSLILIGIGIGTGAAAPERSHVGTLTCTVSAEAEPQGVSQMACGFTPASAGSAMEHYVGSLPSMNAPRTKQVLVWTVIAPSPGKIARGALAQSYRISTAASLLIGQSSAITLQSEGHEGVTELKLTLAAMPV
jgi:Protein of unknown function (DUF992)